jgi:chemotaxis protein methyltransferase CheR
MTSERGGTTAVLRAVPEPTAAEFDALRTLVRRHVGIHLNDTKRALVYGRLAHRVQQLGLSSFSEYVRFIARDTRELEPMTDRITTNETHFFREAKHFAFLDEVVVPAWMQAADAGARNRHIRVWSAGCSTGEEPYSVAMALAERLAASAGWSVEVLATDISSRVLDAAREATWSMDRAHEIPAHLLRRFMLEGFGVQAGRMRATPDLRSVVRVERLNLCDSSYAVGAPFDLVLCRNVLIYFERDLRRRVVDQLISHVAAGGYFFVGHAEAVQAPHELTCLKPTIYRRLTAAERARSVRYEQDLRERERAPSAR